VEVVKMLSAWSVPQGAAVPGPRVAGQGDGHLGDLVDPCPQALAVGLFFQ
jgi:hypothetical protein